MIDPMASVSGWRSSVLRTRRAPLVWMYLLVAVPLITDFIEAGRLPNEPREWLTEVAGGLLIAALVRKIHRDHLEVLALSRTDMLTGLSNRRAFEEAIEDDWARARRTSMPLSLVYIDLDNFKQVNDRSGHGAGDLVLQQLSGAIRKTVRARLDRGFRVGGDEFALLLPGSSAEQAAAVVARIGDDCARSDPVWVGGSLGISAGIVELAPDESVSEFVRRADDAMYRRKASNDAGR
jgi:diguanylate cyclase (GGDEF)-like protein